MGEYPVVGPVPISIAAQAEPPPPPPSHVGGVRGHPNSGLGEPSVGFPSAGILGGSTSEKEANRRGQGDPSG